MNNKRKQLIVKIVAHLVLLLGAITMLVPFIWMLSSSVKSLGEVFVFPPTLFGEKIVWENYTKISSRFDYLAYFLNSVKVSAWVVIFQVFTSATAGYVFAKLNFKGRDRIFTLYLATMMIPFHVTVITNFLQMSMYGLVNTLWSLMLPASVSAFGTFLMRQFFVTVPNELIEAAKIDGCNIMQTLVLVLVPMLWPAMVSAGLFQFMWSSNDFMGPLLYVNSPARYPATLFVRMSMDADTGFAWNRVMAVSLISIIPSLVVFFLAQRQFMDGVTAGAVKG